MDEDLKNKLLSQMAKDENFKREFERVNKLIIELAEQLVKVLKENIHKISIAFRPLVKYKIEQQMLLSMVSSKEYKIAAKEYPKLAHLASRAKKKRVRKKNIKRLYRLGGGLNVHT